MNDSSQECPAKSVKLILDCLEISLLNKRQSAQCAAKVIIFYVPWSFERTESAEWFKSSVFSFKKGLRRASKGVCFGGLSCQHPRRKEGAFPSVFVQLATNNVTFWQEFLPKPAVSQKFNRFFAEYFVSCGMRCLILHQISGDSCTKISDSTIFSNMKIISCVRFE